MHRLRQQQPKLHRQLCDIVFQLAHVRDALVSLPEAYVLEGAMSEMLLLTDLAVREARESLNGPRHRRSQPLPVSPGVDEALARAIQTQGADSDVHTKLILLDASTN